MLLSLPAGEGFCALDLEAAEKVSEPESGVGSRRRFAGGGRVCRSRFEVLLPASQGSIGVMIAPRAGRGQIKAREVL